MVHNEQPNLIEAKGYWQDLSKSFKDPLGKEICIKFPFLCYCNQNWKGNKFVVNWYYCWYQSYILKSDKDGIKVEEDTSLASSSMKWWKLAQPKQASPSEPVISGEVV